MITNHWVKLYKDGSVWHTNLKGRRAVRHMQVEDSRYSPFFKSNNRTKQSSSKPRGVIRHIAVLVYTASAHQNACAEKNKVIWRSMKLLAPISLPAAPSGGRHAAEVVAPLAVLVAVHPSEEHRHPNRQPAQDNSNAASVNRKSRAHLNPTQQERCRCRFAYPTTTRTEATASRAHW